MTALVGMSAPKAEWDARLAEVGPIEARRVFLDDFTDKDIALVPSEAAAGRTVVLSFKTGASTWAQVANGQRDADAKAAFATLQGYGVPVYVTAHHEPIASQSNPLVGDKGSAAEYAGMLDHLAAVAAGYSVVRWGSIFNGYAFSTGPMGLSDDVIGQWLPVALQMNLDFVAADTYQTDKDTVLARMQGFVAWAQRVGYSGRLGIGEFGTYDGAALTAAIGYAQGTGLFDFLLAFNSNVNNRDGRSWQLTGDRLTAFQQAVLEAKAAPAPPDPADQIAQLQAQVADLTAQLEQSQTERSALTTQLAQATADLAAAQAATAVVKADRDALAAKISTALHDLGA